MISFNDRRQVAPAPTRGTITHAKARTIASGWDSPEGSSLRALGAAGTITPHLEREIHERMPEAPTKRAQKSLWQLARYANKSGPRGPVRGWSEIQDPPRVPAPSPAVPGNKPAYKMPASTTAKLRAAEQEIARQQRGR